MTREEKRKLNEDIAGLLGFRKVLPNPDKETYFVQWFYPEDWRELGGFHMTDIPDFLGMMEKFREIMDMRVPRQEYGFMETE